MSDWELLTRAQTGLIHACWSLRRTGSYSYTQAQEFFYKQRTYWSKPPASTKPLQMLKSPQVGLQTSTGGRLTNLYRWNKSLYRWKAYTSTVYKPLQVKAYKPLQVEGRWKAPYRWKAYSPAVPPFTCSFRVLSTLLERNVADVCKNDRFACIVKHLVQEQLNCHLSGKDPA